VSVWSVIASSIIMRRMWGPFRIFYVGFRTPQTGLAQATGAKHLAALRSRQHRAVDSVFTLCSHSLMRHVEDGRTVGHRRSKAGANPLGFGGPKARQGGLRGGSSAETGAAHRAQA
jgi:hypothetical protein